MRAFKCDRCGSFFNYIDKRTGSKVVLEGTTSLDFCPSCQKALNSFLSRPGTKDDPEIVYGSFESFEKAEEALKDLRDILEKSASRVLFLGDVLDYFKTPVRVGIERDQSLYRFGWSESMLDQARAVEYSIVGCPDIYVLALPDPERFYDNPGDSQKKQGL